MTGFLTTLGASLFSGAWKFGLRPGSFRGVKFICRDAANPLGQRLAEFQFPDSDVHYVQPLGQGIKEFKLDILVVGDDYALRRQALEAAMDLAAPGTLVHPYKGEILCYCRYPSRLRELSEKGRAAYFEATFVPVGSVQQPLPDLVATVLSTVAKVKAILAEANDWIYDGQNAAVQAAFGVALGTVQSSIGASLTAPAGSLQLTQDLATLAGVAPDNAAGYSTALGNLFGNYVSNVAADLTPAGVMPDSLTTAGDPTLAPGFQDMTRLPDLPSDPSYGLAALASADFTPAAATGVALSNAQALTQLVNGQATLSLASLYAQTGFASSADAQAAQDQLSGLVAGQIEAASASGNDALAQAWRAVGTASVANLSASAAAAPDLATVITPDPQPALVMAQQLYQDGTQAPGLVQQNGAPHPLFLPQSVEYLAS